MSAVICRYFPFIKYTQVTWVGGGEILCLMLIFGLQKVFQALYPQDKGRRGLSVQPVWLGVSLAFFACHTEGLFWVTHPCSEERGKREDLANATTELPQREAKSPSSTNQAMTLVQFKSFATEEKDKSTLEQRHFAWITWIFTFQKKGILCFPPQTCSQMLLLKQMFSQHPPLPQVPLPAMHTPATQNAALLSLLLG